MKIWIPPFEPMLKSNEHLRRPGFELDLGEDITQVVRCKDCKYWSGSWCSGIPFNGDDAAYIETQENDYCSYGERKDEHQSNV